MIRRTHDMNIVQAILDHPRIARDIREDDSPDQQAIDHESIHWLLVTDDAPAGVFLVHPTGSHCYELHTCLLPRIWGAGATLAADLVLAHVFDVIGARKLITKVPASNRKALRYAQAAGLQIEGVNRASFLRNGAMEDQIMLGITEQEWKSCQQSPH